MNVHEIDPKEALKKTDYEYHERGMAFFYGELVTLNVNLFLMDKIADFRFDLFTAVEQRTFFRMVFQNFFYASLLIITRVAADQGKDLFTLPRFKNTIRQSVKPQYRDLLDNRLRQAKFDRRIQKLLDKARDFRIQRVAHVLEEAVFGEGNKARVIYSDLKELRDQLNDLLDALSFNVHHMMLPVQYSEDVIHPKGRDPRPDIERILDSIAEKSYLLNMPEQEPIHWSFRQKNLSDEDLGVLNHYRSKFGLDPVPLIEDENEI